jgi:hypothetical protein
VTEQLSVRDHEATAMAIEYTDFAARQAHGVSLAYERLARAVSQDPEIWSC